MKTVHLPVVAILLGAIVVSGQDSNPDEFESFSQLKESVHRITTQHIYTGWDAKAFNRSGDMVAVAIVKALPESELTSPATVKEILGILHSAFACPSDALLLPTTGSPMSRCYCWSTYAPELVVQCKLN